MRGAKYTKLNAFPLALFDALSKPLNIYFIVVALLSWSPSYIPKDSISNTVTLCVIILMQVSKEIYDDSRRYKMDRRANEQTIKVYSHKQMTFIEKPARKLEIGDLLMID